MPLTPEKLREGGKKRWAGVTKAERRRAMKRARRGLKFKARKTDARFTRISLGENTP